MQEAIVGIDFGTSGTGYAYSFNDNKNIELGKFKGQNTGIKVPTEIILDSELQDVLSFGEKCSSYKLKKGDLHFKNIKMNIYHKNKYIRPENDSNEFFLIDIIAKILEFVKKIALYSVQENKPSIREDQIKWVVTVPSIWELEQKSIMISASEKAGLFNQYTDRANFFALEPEVASLYCLNDNSIEKNYLLPGKTYIVCDLGGGTGDIVTHFRAYDNKIQEKHQCTGGPYGSEEIEHRIFKEVVGKIFGYCDIHSLKEKFKRIQSGQDKKPEGFENNEQLLDQQWEQLQKSIKDMKNITKEQKDQTKVISFQIFHDFTDGVSINDLVDKFNESCPEGWKIKISSVNFWLLELPYKIIFDLIKDHGQNIANKISEICSKVKEVESILYVGGYCSNDVLINYLKDKFPNLAHLKPSCPEKAVVIGAVLFGINPYFIDIRKAMFTIGFNCDDIWDDKIHGGIGEKYYDPIYKIYKCKNSFHAFIRIGDDLSQKQYIEQSFITMNSRNINLKFFKSLKRNPVLYDEDGVQLIGEVQLDLGKNFPENEKNFILRLNMGGTFLVASCFHPKSLREIKFPLYFN